MHPPSPRPPRQVLGDMTRFGSLNLDRVPDQNQPPQIFQPGASPWPRIRLGPGYNAPRSPRGHDPEPNPRGTRIAGLAILAAATHLAPLFRMPPGQPCDWWEKPVGRMGTWHFKMRGNIVKVHPGASTLKRRTGAQRGSLKAGSMVRARFIFHASVFIAALGLMPGPAFAGCNEWTSNGPYGGGISIIAVDPVTPTTLYAGTKGVYKSTDGGASWTAINNGFPEPIPALWTLAIDPQSPETVYAGTVHGIYKTTNGGCSWSAIKNGILDNAEIRSFALNPLTPSTVYAGTWGQGLFRSTDGGASWAAIGSEIPGDSFMGIAVDPSAPATLYVASAGGYGIFKSTDRGDSWHPANNGLPESRSTKALVINPQDPETIYVGLHASGGFGGVYRSKDGGASWAPACIGLPDFGVDYVSLAINPLSPATLYATAWYSRNSWLFRSTDGGLSWDYISPEDIFPVQLSGAAVDPVSPAKVDAGSGAGVFKSADGGSTWISSTRE